MITKNLIGLLISTLLIILLYSFIKKQNKQTDLKKPFLFILFCLLIWCLGLIAQIVCTTKFNMNPIYFDYFVYIGTCFTPIAFLVMSIKFSKTPLAISIKELCFTCSLVPIFCLLVLWTNDIHHLFYISYSTMLSEGVYGPFFYITTAYTYLLFAISLIFIAKYSIKNIKFYFVQAILIFLGALVPIVVNVLGVIGVFNLSIYVTPICFSITILLFSLSIFKFGFLNITPIALKNIVNRISDSYIVLNNDLIVVDFNQTLLRTFKTHGENIINKNLLENKKVFKDFNTISKKLENAIKKTRTNDSTVVLDEYFKSINKYFHIEVNRLTDGSNLLGTLLLIKDVTQHKLDLDTIKNNQDILIEKERLASLGQMIGRNST